MERLIKFDEAGQYIFSEELQRYIETWQKIIYRRVGANMRFTGSLIHTKSWFGRRGSVVLKMSVGNCQAFVSVSEELINQGSDNIFRYVIEDLAEKLMTELARKGAELSTK